jgi:hypothetical protein
MPDKLFLKRLLNRLMLLSLSLWCMGALSKIQHWPYGRAMLTTADFLLFAIFALLLFLPDKRVNILRWQAKLAYGGATLLFGMGLSKLLGVHLHPIILQTGLLMLLISGILYVVALFTHKKSNEIPARFAKLPVIEVLELMLQPYTGTYVNNQLPLKITFTRDANILIAQAAQQAPFQLQAIGANLFKYDAAGIVIMFDSTGQHMVVYQHGGEFPFVRV